VKSLAGKNPRYTLCHSGCGVKEHRNQQKKTFKPPKKKQNEQQEHGKIINNFEIFNNNFHHSNVSVLLFLQSVFI
jgi:hypothetical protein